MPSNGGFRSWIARNGCAYASLAALALPIGFGIYCGVRANNLNYEINEKHEAWVAADNTARQLDLQVNETWNKLYPDPKFRPGVAYTCNGQQAAQLPQAVKDVCTANIKRNSAHRESDKAYETEGKVIGNQNSWELGVAFAGFLVMVGGLGWGLTKSAENDARMAQQPEHPRQH